jgi:hypothetical protein
MPMSTIEIGYLGQVFSPFSGQPTELNDEGPNQTDPTLLFVYYGMAGAWDYMSPRFPTEVTRFVDNVEPAELAESLDVDGAVMFVVDTDWNGINYYGFAPEDSEIKLSAGVTFTDPVE